MEGAAFVPSWPAVQAGGFVHAFGSCEGVLRPPVVAHPGSGGGITGRRQPRHPPPRPPVGGALDRGWRAREAVAGTRRSRYCDGRRGMVADPLTFSRDAPIIGWPAGPEPRRNRVY